MKKIILLILTCLLAFSGCYSNNTNEILTSSGIYELSEKSTVEIVTYNKKNEELSLGSGFVLSSNRKIATCYHVIEDAYSIEIHFSDKRIYKVTHC